MRLALAVTALVIVVCLGLLLAWPSLIELRALEAYSEAYRGLRVTLKVNESTVKVNEILKVKVEVVNVGEEPITLYHGHRLLYVAIYNVTTDERICIHPPFVLDILITTTLQPGNQARLRVKSTS